MLGNARGCRVEGLRLSSRQGDGSLIVEVGGELDIVTSREFDEYLTKTRKAHDRIVLDLTSVDFMDTSSLAVIVGHWKAVLAAGGFLALAGPRYRYTKTLWITGLADRLPTYATVEEAVAAARGDTAAAPATANEAQAPASEVPPAKPRARRPRGTRGKAST
jgi:anti-anti-sigma factor